MDLSIEIFLPTATSMKISEEEAVNHATGSLSVASIALKILSI